MIIWLASYPRSGNTFLRMLLYYSCGFKSYSTYNDPLLCRLDAAETVGHEPLPAPEVTLAGATEVYFVKTHNLPVDSKRAIYIVRDGRDAIVSFAHYIRSFERKPGALNRFKELFEIHGFHKTLEYLITSKTRYGGWNDNVLAWLNRTNNDGQLILRYEDLMRDPQICLSNVLNHFDIKSKAKAGRTMPGFDTLHRKWPQFFRKGKTGSWRDELPPGLHELFWQHHAEAMNALGYRR